MNLKFEKNGERQKTISLHFIISQKLVENKSSGLNFSKVFTLGCVGLSLID